MALVLRDAWHIRSAADAAQARIVAGRLTAEAGVPPLERARFLVAVTARLRQCLHQGGADLTLTVRNSPGRDGQPEIAVQPAGEPDAPPSWQITVACHAPVRQMPTQYEATEAAEALLAADEDLAEVVDRLQEKQDLVRFHREELHTLLLRFDLRTGTVHAVDAGSPQLFRLRDDAIEQVELEAQLPLGMFEETPYKEQTFRVEPGDRLIAVSTGVHGTRSTTGDVFGERVLRQVLSATRSTAPHETAHAVVSALIEHFGSRDLIADAAVVCLDWKGRPVAPPPIRP